MLSKIFYKKGYLIIKYSIFIIIKIFKNLNYYHVSGVNFYNNYYHVSGVNFYNNYYHVSGVNFYNNYYV
jgi:hypothetical protein